MIFDSPKVQALCQKYAPLPEARHPLIVRLAQYPEVAEERDYIERLVAAAPAKTQSRWIAGLTDSDAERHLPAWFEVMLFGWLSEVGRVAVEPSVEGCEPDFCLCIDDDPPIYIEAKAVLKKRPDREHESRLAELMSILERIQFPYVVHVKGLRFGRSLLAEELIAQVSAWLRSSPKSTYHYHDEHGNTATFSAEYLESLDSVGVVGPVRSFWVDSDSLKPFLKKKASQHPGLREARHPYVLAFLQERWVMSAEEFVEAWLGKTEYVIDVASHEVVDQRLKPSGIHFYRSNINYTSVSGTLVFQAEWDQAVARRTLKGWYVENPFATVRVDPEIFPVMSRFVVVSGHGHDIRMDWRQSNSTTR